MTLVSIVVILVVCSQTLQVSDGRLPSLINTSASAVFSTTREPSDVCDNPLMIVLAVGLVNGASTFTYVMAAENVSAHTEPQEDSFISHSRSTPTMRTSVAVGRFRSTAGRRFHSRFGPHAQLVGGLDE
jgi:hypothetical protein